MPNDKPNSDLLEEALKAEGSHERVQGMETPEEIAAREDAEARSRGEGGSETTPPAAKQTPTPPATPGVKHEGIDLDQLQQKVLKGETLTEEEAKVAAQIGSMSDEDIEKAANPPAPVIPDKTYVVNGQSFTFREMEAQFRKEKGIGDVKINAAGLEKLVDSFVGELNRSEANRVIDKGFRDNAAERQQLTAERMRLADERKALQRRAGIVEQQMAEVNALLEIAVTKEDLADPGTGQLDPDKLALYVKRSGAKEQFDRLKAEADELKTEIQQNAEEQVRKETLGFILAHAEYATSEPFSVLAQKESQGLTLDASDRIKITEIMTLFREAKALGRSLEEAWEYRKAAGTLAVKPSAHAAAQGAGGNGSGLPKPAIPSAQQLLADKIAKLNEKKRNAPPATGGGGGGERGAEGEKSMSRRLVEHDRTVTGVEKNDFLRKDLGFN